MEIIQSKTKPRQGDDFLTIQDFGYLCLARWKWFVLSLVVILGVAVVYLLKTPPVFMRTADILIKDDSHAKSASAGVENFADLGLFQTTTNINNELISLRSPSVMLEVVKRLHLDVAYSESGRFHRQVVYGTDLPVQVLFPDLSDIESASFTLHFLKDGQVELSDFVRNDVAHEGTVRGRLSDTLKTVLGNVVLEPVAAYDGRKHSTLYVTRQALNSVVGSYASRLSVALSDEKSTVVSLSLTDESPARAEDVLNTLISVYNENWVKDKNQIAVSTSLFINERLGVIERELGHVDDDISSYKSEHLLPDVQAASSMYMTQSSETNAQIQALNNQLYMTRYIRNYLTDKGKRNQLLPANTGVGNATLENQIAEYNASLLQRNSLVANSSERNPLVVDLDRSLAEMRSGIISSIDNQIVTLNTQVNNLQRTEQQTTARIAANPQQAKYLLSVERQQKVKESLYLFLLQKREENELSQAFTAYNTRVITPPRGSMVPTAPQKRNILLVAFAVGLLLPAVLVFLREAMNTKVRGRKDLEGLNVPLIGEIPFVAHSGKRLGAEMSDKLRQPVVEEGNRDVINEAFRVLRTNLEFMTEKSNRSHVLVLTSFNAGSGKSFLSINIAVSLAIKGKKVLVIDGDMRHGSASAYVGSPSRGLSDYLSGHTDVLDQLIVTDQLHPTLDVLPVGTIPPNPTELLFDQRLTHVLDFARAHYDYVFIDCPPVELVADTQIIEKLADRTLFVVRAGLLERSMLGELEQIYEEKKYKNMVLVLNGTEGAGGRYGYKYGYRYGYHYGYGSDYHYGGSKKKKKSFRFWSSFSR